MISDIDNRDTINNLTELIASRQTALDRATDLYPKWRRAQEITTQLGESYQHAKKDFEALDHEIALEQLALELVKPKSRKPQQSPEDKIMAMLAKLPAAQREAIIASQRELLAKGVK